MFIVITLLFLVPLMIFLPETHATWVFGAWYFMCIGYYMWKEPTYYPQEKSYRERFYEIAPKKKEDKPLIQKVN